jgi:hypothetical protein
MSMTGATMVIPMVAVSLLAGGCAHPAAAAPPETAKPAHEPASVTLEYEVTRKEDNGVVLSGRTSVDATHEAAVAHDARDHEELRFAARERGDGTFDVGVRYREVAPDGTSIRWEPTLRVARGATASVDVAGSGWSRGLRVKLD